jgi:alpha-beta hydrolase superfamily lysophospholipase
MNHFEQQWTSKDGLALYSCGWLPDQPPKAVVCLVHGLGEHSGRYAHVAEYLNQAGFAVLSFDLRGHGRSGGKRGHTPSFEAFMQDIDLLMQEAQTRYPDLPRFLYGHSLGGILVLNYGLRRQPALAGVVATSSGLRTSLETQKAKIAMSKFLGALTPGMSIPTGLDAGAISRDPDVVRIYRSDPLVHGMGTVGMAKSLFDAIQWAFAHGREWKLPLLLMHGSADQIAYLRGSQEFAELAGHHATLKVWEGLAHECHNEPEKEQVLAFLLGWLEARLVEQA